MAAYWYWRVGMTSADVAWELGMTRKGIEELLKKFRRRGDRFFRSLIFCGLGRISEGYQTPFGEIEKAAELSEVRTR
jgi:hypothetical protein